jgi:hypothetical protein
MHGNCPNWTLNILPAYLLDEDAYLTCKCSGSDGGGDDDDDSDGDILRKAHLP